MSPCEHAHHEFSPYWEAELAADRRERLERHWESCASCRADYDAFVAAIEAVRSLPHLEAPAGFAARVLVQSRERAADRSLAALWSRWLGAAAARPALDWRTGLAAAAAVLAVVVGVGLVNQLRPDSPGSVAVLSPAPEAVESSDESAPRIVVPEAIAPQTSRQLAAAPAERETDVTEREVEAARVAPAADTHTLAMEQLPEGTGGPTESLLDSLFRRDLDVEFALDRIRLRQVAGDSIWTPVPPMPGAPEGRPASLTF